MGVRCRWSSDRFHPLYEAFAMRAAILDQPGPPEALRVVDRDPPAAGPDDVLIDVEFVSVNPIDTYLRSGTVDWNGDWPMVPGCDAAGIVAAVGQNVRTHKVGDPVWCCCQGVLGRPGTAAEQISVPAPRVYRRPDAVSSADMAAIGLTGMTAHLGLFRDAKISSSETVVVIGGTGGVGSMVVQMAKAAGARVITTASTDRKAEAAKRIGADEVIRYRETSMMDAIADLVPNGVDVFWETRREPDLLATVPLMRHRGRIVLMAGRDAVATLPIGPFYVNELRLIGLVMFKASDAEMAQSAEKIAGLAETGQLRPLIDRTLDLDEIATAHRLQQSATVEGTGSLLGKLLIRIR